MPAVPLRLAIVALLLPLAACDSGIDTPPLFEALQGTWATAADTEPSTIRFLPRGRYEFLSGGEVTEQGRFSLASDGEAADPDALPALRDIQFNPEGDGVSASFFNVVSADASALSLQRCLSECDGVATRVYRRR